MTEEHTDTASETGRLRAENAALREQVAAAYSVGAIRNARMRNGIAIAIAVIATFMIALAIPALWVNRMVTSTDYYVATVSPLARDIAIQDAVADFTADAALERLDLQLRFESQLPDELQFLAGPISSAADGFVRKQATAFVRSETFPQTWDRANEVGHAAFVAAVTGRDDGAVRMEAGTITLELGVLVDQFTPRLSDSGFALADRIPASAVDRGLTLYRSDTLARLTALVDTTQRIALMLPLVGIALLSGAVAVAFDRRKTLLWAGANLLVWTLMPLQMIYIGQGYVGAQLQSWTSIPSVAAQNAYGIIFADLLLAERLFVLVSVLVIGATLVAGPSAWAVALRRGLSGGIAGVSAHLELGAFGHWVGQRIGALRTVGYLIAAALLVLLPAPRTFAQLWWIVGLLVVWLFGVQLTGSASAVRESD